MDQNKTFPSVRTGGGVRLRIGAKSIGKIGRPGPGRPGRAILWQIGDRLMPPGDVEPGAPAGTDVSDMPFTTSIPFPMLTM